MNKYETNVEKILESYEKSRDSDYALYFYYVRDFHKVNLREITAYELFKLTETKELPLLSTISRIRRSVQEQYMNTSKEYLCGNRSRKKKLEKEVSEQIIKNKIQHE